MKTNKHQTLLFTRNKEVIRARDIVTQFKYSSGTARSYLSYLSRHGLLEWTVTGYILTEKGTERLEYFDATGCRSFDCPLCVKKKSSHYICPHCEYELPMKDARIRQEEDYILITSDAGVYCPECKKMMFDEKQALLLGISKEK